MALWLELLIAALLILAGLFAIVGSFGLIRLPDPMTRLHAPTKATTLGIGGVLVASMLYSWAAFGRLSAHELLITLFLFLSAPITAFFIGKVHLHARQDRAALPPAPSSGTRPVASRPSWDSHAPRFRPSLRSSSLVRDVEGPGDDGAIFASCVEATA